MCAVPIQMQACMARNLSRLSLRPNLHLNGEKEICCLLPDCYHSYTVKYFYYFTKQIEPYQVERNIQVASFRCFFDYSSNYNQFR